LKQDLDLFFAGVLRWMVPVSGLPVPQLQGARDPIRIQTAYRFIIAAFIDLLTALIFSDFRGNRAAWNRH
jgi:hypothetical protein